MADDERDEPSLELPSFGLGRRRARKDRFLEPDPLTAPLEQVEAEPQAREAASEVVPEPLAEPVEEAAPEPAGARKATREPRQPRRQGPTRPPRSAGGFVAALATGLLVGALTVLLTWLSQRGCEAVRDTSSCGDPGLLVLLAILVVMVLVGATGLRLARVADPGSTSFLAVGLLTVLALLFLVGSLFEWWVVIVVPVLSMFTFALSHWVTTSFAGDDDGDR